MRKYSNLVKKIEVFEKLALYGSRSSFLNRIAQIAPDQTTPPTDRSWDSLTRDERDEMGLYTPLSGPPAPPETESPINLTPQEKAVGQNQYPKSKSKYPAIDKKIQQMLGTVNPDGILGPQTQAALNAYKASIGQPSYTNEQAIASLKQEPGYAGGQALVFDDNSNTYSNPSKMANRKLYVLLNKFSQMSQEPNASVMPDEPNSTPNPDAKFGPPSPPAKAVLPTVPTSVQQSLNFLSQEAGTPMNLKLDGQLGPATRRALNWFATANNLVGKSDQELFTEVANKQQQAVSKATKQPATQGPSVGTPEMSNIKAPQSRV